MRRIGRVQVSNRWYSLVCLLGSSLVVSIFLTVMRLLLNLAVENSHNHRLLGSRPLLDARNHDQGYSLNLSSFESEVNWGYRATIAEKNSISQSSGINFDEEVARDRQDRESPWARILFINTLWSKTRNIRRTKICIATVTSADVSELYVFVLPWIQYHLEQGVSRFYVYYDGIDPEVLNILRSIHPVSITAVRTPFADSLTLTNLQGFRHQHREWGGRPGNFELMVTQAFAVDDAIHKAKKERMEWILHLDQDELFISEREQVSTISELLRFQPAYIGAIKFFNHEAYPESLDIIHPFKEVTLFKANPSLLSKYSLSHAWKAVIGENKGLFLLYGNGKTVARVDAPNLRQHGPHEFIGGPSERWKTADNPHGEWRIHHSERSAILHYSYCTLDTILKKSQRSCPKEYREAAIRNDRMKTKECFVLDFDQDVYHVAARGSLEEIRSFFLSRVVFQQGVVGKCTREGLKGFCRVEDVEQLKTFLLREGVLRRYHGPQQILRVHERSLRGLIEKNMTPRLERDLGPFSTPAGRIA